MSRRRRVEAEPQGARAIARALLDEEARETDERLAGYGDDEAPE